MLFVAVYPPLSKDCLLSAYLSTFMSKAFPVVNEMFSSLGMWFMESSPMNSNDPSESSDLKTLTIPFGNGMPSLLSLEFKNYILLVALMLFYEYPPALIVI